VQILYCITIIYLMNWLYSGHILQCYLIVYMACSDGVLLLPFVLLYYWSNFAVITCSVANSLPSCIITTVLLYVNKSHAYYITALWEIVCDVSIMICDTYFQLSGLCGCLNYEATAMSLAEVYNWKRNNIQREVDIMWYEWNINHMHPTI